MRLSSHDARLVLWQAWQPDSIGDGSDMGTVGLVLLHADQGVLDVGVYSTLIVSVLPTLELNSITPPRPIWEDQSVSVDIFHLNAYLV